MSKQIKPSGQPLSKEAQTILVTGGSGFIGRNFVKKMANEKVIVSLYHHRLPEPMTNVYPVCSDLSSPELLAAPLRGVDTVVYLAWERNFLGPAEIKGESTSRSRSKNITLLKNMVSAMENSRAKRIVFISANGAQRNAKSEFLKEKYEGELVVLNSKIPEKIIIRSNLVVDTHKGMDGFIKSILDLMKFPGFYPVPKFANNLCPVHIDDLVDIISMASVIERVDGCSIVEVVGQESLKIDEFFRLVSNKYNPRNQVQIRGVLGNTLLPVFERRSMDSLNSPRIRNFLTLNNERSKALSDRNPLLSRFSPSKRSIRKEMSKTH